MTLRWPDADDPREWDDDVRPQPSALEDAVAAWRAAAVSTRRIQAWATAEADRNFG